MAKDSYKYIKSHDHYTEDELQQILSQARSEKEYDYLIDKLYLAECDHTRVAKRREYSYLTVRNYARRTRIETPFIYEGEWLSD